MLNASWHPKSAKIRSAIFGENSTLLESTRPRLHHHGGIAFELICCVLEVLKNDHGKTPTPTLVKTAIKHMEYTTR